MASAKSGKLTLAALALIPSDVRLRVHRPLADNAAFDAEGLVPNVVLTALDSDVIKTYVELGMGVGIVARMANNPEETLAFEMLDAGHLFASSTTRIAIRRGGSCAATSTTSSSCLRRRSIARRSTPRSRAPKSWGARPEEDDRGMAARP